MNYRELFYLSEGLGHEVCSNVSGGPGFRAKIADQLSAQNGGDVETLDEVDIGSRSVRRVHGWVDRASRER